MSPLFHLISTNFKILSCPYKWETSLTFSPKRVASKTMGTTIYVGKPKILLRKSNGLQHSVWEVSTNIECDLRQSNHFSLFPRFRLFGYTLQTSGNLFHHVRCYILMVTHKISNRGVCVNGKHLISQLICFLDHRTTTLLSRIKGPFRQILLTWMKGNVWRT